MQRRFLLPRDKSIPTMPLESAFPFLGAITERRDDSLFRLHRFALEGRPDNENENPSRTPLPHVQRPRAKPAFQHTFESWRRSPITACRTSARHRRRGDEGDGHHVDSRAPITTAKTDDDLLNAKRGASPSRPRSAQPTVMRATIDVERFAKASAPASSPRRAQRWLLSDFAAPFRRTTSVPRGA
jgi:hypothetical protein